MTFEGILLIVAKVGFAIFALLFLIKRLLVLPYLWFKYDKPIIDLKKELDTFRKKEQERGTLQPFVDGSIRVKTNEVNEKLDILETERRLFLDRVNIFLFIVSIDKK